MRHLPMITKVFFIASCFIFIAWVQERPAWINPKQREVRFPQDQYFVGYSSYYFNRKEDLNKVGQRVKNLARASLCETIQVSIKSTSTNELQSLDGISFENYNKSVVTTSSLDARGLKTEHFIDSKKGIAYAISYVTKKELIDGYSKELTSRLESIGLRLRNAANVERIKENYLTYLEVLSELDGLKPVQSILRKLEAADQSNLWNAYFLVTNERLESLRQAEDLTLAGASQLLSARILEKLEENVGSVTIQNFTYKGSTLGSDFSGRLKYLLTEDFESAGIEVIESAAGGRYILVGSYWPDNEKIQVSAEVKEVDGYEPVRIVASTTVFISKQPILEEGIAVEPHNYEEAHQISQLISEGERADNGIHVELWTNKSGQAQVFKEGDRLKLSVRVNHPAYIRLLNVWSDDTAVLLLDNEFISVAESNQILEVGQEFETQCPCGTEHLQVLAQTEPFTELHTVEEDGFIFVQDPLREVLEKSRNGEESKSYAEHIITVTTIPQ